jgi:hypothetical protein
MSVTFSFLKISNLLYLPLRLIRIIPYLKYKNSTVLTYGSLIVVILSKNSTALSMLENKTDRIKSSLGAGTMLSNKNATSLNLL